MSPTPGCPHEGWTEIATLWGSNVALHKCTECGEEKVIPIRIKFEEDTR